MPGELISYVTIDVSRTLGVPRDLHDAFIFGLYRYGAKPSPRGECFRLIPTSLYLAYVAMGLELLTGEPGYPNTSDPNLIGDRGH